MNNKRKAIVEMAIIGVMLVVIAIFYLMLSPTIAHVGHSIQVSTDKEVYSIGEPVKITCTNTGWRTIERGMPTWWINKYDDSKTERYSEIAYVYGDRSLLDKRPNEVIFIDHWTPVEAGHQQVEAHILMPGLWHIKDTCEFIVTPKPVITPLLSFHISTNVSSLYIPQGGSAVLEVNLFLPNMIANLTGTSVNTISLSLDSSIGEVPPFVNATFDPDAVTLEPDQQATSTLTLKINSTAPIGRYGLSARGTSSTFGPYVEYNGIPVCGVFGSSLSLTVIPSTGEIPAELPLYFYQNGTRMLAPTPVPTPTPMPTSTPTPSPPIPGFEAVFAIIGLLAVAYFVQRRNKSK